MSNRVQTIVAGISLPAEDDPTLVAAAELARWTGAALHLVHAFDLPALFSPPELGYVPPEWAREMADSRRALLQAAAARVPGAASADCRAVPGPAAPALLEAARDAGAHLLVVGAARPGRLFAAFLGTTAQRVLRGAERPVLVVRRSVHRPLRRVLLATDLSPASAAAHEQGLDTAAAFFGPPAAARSLLVLPYLFVPSPLPHEAMERRAGPGHDVPAGATSAPLLCGAARAHRRPRRRDRRGGARVGRGPRGGGDARPRLGGAPAPGERGRGHGPRGAVQRARRPAAPRGARVARAAAERGRGRGSRASGLRPRVTRV